MGQVGNAPKTRQKKNPMPPLPGPCANIAEGLRLQSVSVERHPMRPRSGYRSLFISPLVAALLTASGGASGSATAVDSINVAIEKPLVTNLYASPAATSIARFVVTLASVGSARSFSIDFSSGVEVSR